LKLYSDQPQINDKDSEAGIIGQRQESIAIVATKAGRYTLPEVFAYWFDTKTKKLKKASLAAVTFTVAPNEKILTEPPEPLITADIDGNADTLDKPKILIPFGNSDVFPWQVATLITTVLWLITLIYAFVSKGNAQTQAKAAQQPTIATLTEANAFKKLRSACRDKDAKLVMSSCLQWVAIHWRNPSITHINAVATHTDPDLAALLTQLEETIYGATVLDNTLYKDISSRSEKLRGNKSQGPSDKSLAPLYKI
jgi:hypothetical protein